MMASSRGTLGKRDTKSTKQDDSSGKKSPKGASWTYIFNVKAKFSPLFSVAYGVTLVSSTTSLRKGKGPPA